MAVIKNVVAEIRGRFFILYAEMINFQIHSVYCGCKCVCVCVTSAQTERTSVFVLLHGLTDASSFKAERAEVMSRDCE